MFHIKMKEIRRIFFVFKIFLKYRLLEILLNRKVKIFPFFIKSKKSLAKRIRLSFQELGPVWIKLGQFLSTRDDLFSRNICKQLSLLQNKVKAFDGKLAKTYIEKSLGKNFEKIFIHFNENPIASASISQVHSAILRKNNISVVIKVIRPDIIPIIEIDIKLLSKLAKWIKLFYKIKCVQIEDLIKEYKKTIFNELNLLNESVNTIQLRRNFRDDPMLYIPKIYIEHSRKNIMIAERIYGISILNTKKLNKYNLNLKKLAENGVKIFFKQIFRDNFFHADMHPGNILVDYKSSRYIGVDCGIVGSLTKQNRYFLAKNFINFFNRNYRKIAESLFELSDKENKEESEIDEIELFIRTICEPIFRKPISEISFGKFLLQLFRILNNFDIKIHPQLVLLQKNLLYVESLGKKLYPSLDLWKTAKPFIEGWLHQQLKISSFLNKIKKKIPILLEYFIKFPDLIDKFLKFNDFYMKNIEKKNSQLLLKNSKKVNRLTCIMGLIFLCSIFKIFLFLFWLIYSKKEIFKHLFLYD
ncbi:AarF/UbiB family protein [Candidatus Riesia pediculicola]|uniref:Ubiquinone biosynthesis protein n=1 Tax=Riesia pediculicola (strain USDA) TaxID=515618 RepID=D4G8W5_RIEPU|nr:AarF/UbiB family protein [Candidatus Riesia pediculicola]ADD79743.1 ubiquinone biosynthesis protein [Candidatus Riesia pediculicola USDA]ARC53976.1 ubiquinone biosynthesis protein UbiB [Candidatus Riesia pediculicola]QOJ86603.1 ubiquinone biosynthesis regulatory protein kinase UbiB [Candidatus Riesia pediculicola]